MNIKIIGSNCSNGIKLKKLLLKVANNYDGDVEIELKDDQESMRKYNIKNIPGLVIEKYLNILSHTQLIKKIPSNIGIFCCELSNSIWICLGTST